MCGFHKQANLFLLFTGTAWTKMFGCVLRSNQIQSKEELQLHQDWWNHACKWIDLHIFSVFRPLTQGEKKTNKQNWLQAFWKKDPKHTRGWRECFLIGQNMQIFKEVLFFQAMYAVSSIRLTEAKWTDSLFLCFYVVHSLEKEGFLKNLHILFCYVQLKSVLFNLCVLDLFT